MRIHVRLVQISLVIVSLLAHSRTLGQPAQADSTLTDSAKSAAADTLIKPRIPILLMGSIDRSLPDDQVITDSDKHFIDYRYLGDLLSNEEGLSVLEFGVPGQWQQLFSEGIDARSIQIMSDGAPLNDGTSGTYNLNYYPTENIDRIEFIRGTQAYVYGINSPGGVINILSLSKKAIRPYSHLRYSETAYGEAFIDGMLSQDILRGLNMTAGAFHATYNGRYLNSNEDHWNGRIKLRYNLSDYVNIAASGNYNQTYVGLFGGVSASPDSAYNQFLATIRNGDAYEKVTRNDLQLNIAQKFPGDSNAVSTLTVYYSNQLREYRDEENRLTPNGIFVQQDQNSKWYGVRFEHQRNVGNQSITLGGEYRAEKWYENIFEHTSNLFGIARLHPVELLQITPSLRLDNLDGNQPSSLAYGGDVALQPSPWFELTGGFSHSKRYPSSEFNGTPTIITTNLSNPETHDLFETGVRVHDGPFYSCDIDFFHRNIKNAFSVGPNTFTDLPEPLAFVSHQKRILQGFSAQTSLRYGSFILEGTAQYLDINDPQDSVVTLPRWSANGGLYFWDTLLAHHLHLKIGPQVRAFSSYFGREFNQQALTYLPGGQEMEIPGSAILNFIIIARLGDAYIHIVLDNLLDRQYVMNTFYPMVDRSLRFGVSWDFSN
jgi:outer membrane cobalamin receptor